MSTQTPRDPRKIVEALMPEVYPRLRARAGALMRDRRARHVPRPIAVMSEAFLDLVRVARLDVSDRGHFMAVASPAMRQVLVEAARVRLALRRGGDRLRVALAEKLVNAPERGEDVLALNDALDALARKSEGVARIVVWNYFGGLTLQEIADETGYSRRLVVRLLRGRRAWLRRELARE